MATEAVSDSIIIWDDNDPPSSPFVTEVGDTSRQVSKTMKQAASIDPEIDAIFNDMQETPAAQKIVMMDTDKENYQPEGTTPSAPPETPFKTPMEQPDQTTASRPTTGRGQMLPPSTIKRTQSPILASTAKKPSHAATARLEDATPSRPRFARATTNTSDTTSASDPPTAADETGIDDTCFSTFSAVPDMTLFAKLGQSSPTKPLLSDGPTPRAGGPTKKRVSPSRSPSPTPRRQKSQTPAGTTNGNETTSLLIDFTQQIEGLAPSSPTRTRPAGLSPSRTESNLLSYINNARSPHKTPRSNGLPGSPSKSNLLNLLDFELPPPPTPRSAPQFTAREVESLKSGFASTLSGVKAKLSGKEAEVEALKKALEDAERRVGEAQEAERMERGKREDAEREKESWERRGTEVERLLGTVREEVMKVEGEREGLVRRCEEAEGKVGEVEGKCLELQTRLAVGVAGDGDGEAAGEKGEEVQRLVQMQLDTRIEAVSRELHAVYKKKHESKVATLKKSYEARGEKRCAELQARLDEALKANDEMKMMKDETFSGDLGLGKGGASKEDLEERRLEAERYRTEVEEQNARMSGMEKEMQSLKNDFVRLQGELEAERMEKGDLVAAVDEMLALQATDSLPQAVAEDFRRSLSRPAAAVRAPAPGMSSESRLARPSGLARPGSGKSKMMSNIERMGAARMGEN